jgi:hypothetical protein
MTMCTARLIIPAISHPCEEEVHKEPDLLIVGMDHRISTSPYTTENTAVIRLGESSGMMCLRRRPHDDVSGIVSIPFEQGAR